MKNVFLFCATTLALAFSCTSRSAQKVESSMTEPKPSLYLELEDIDAPQALSWVEQRNQQTYSELKSKPLYPTLEKKSLSLLDAKDRIPFGTFRDKYVYNFWQDENHKRGLWRRQLRSDYTKAAEKWETVLDIDALSKAENKSWVYKGNAHMHGSKRTMVMLSPGGGDAVELREFDLEKKAFVPDGFKVPVTKYVVDWIDNDTVIVGTAMTPEESTDSGYARVLKIWKRGEPLEKAKPFYEVKKTDVWVNASRLESGAKHLIVITRGITFFESEKWIFQNGKLIPFDVPVDSDIADYIDGEIVVRLKSDWNRNGKIFKLGSVIAVSLTKDFAIADVTNVIEPTATLSIDNVVSTPSALYISVLENVRGKILRFQKKAGKWESKPLPFPEFGTVSLRAADPDNDVVMVSSENFTMPTTLFLYSEKTKAAQKLYALPSRFDANKYDVNQHFATSKDGTKIPYFVVSSRGGSRGAETPTLLYGYGGFEVSMLPSYATQVESGWLSQGGSYVLANIRGGGEFGPAWHKAALKENRQIAFDDFIAVAEDLVKRKVTSPKHLGIMGGSNGGLLVGTVMTQRPDLFGAVVIQVPLLDMLRFHKLLAGASWMAEYGNPDVPAEAAVLEKYSPFQNVKKGVAYPKVFLMTSTRDDRVHPGHARRMAARLTDFGHSALYYENTEGGHGGSADNTQLARWYALEYTFLNNVLAGQ